VQVLNDTLTTARLLGLAWPRPGRTTRTGRLPAAHRAQRPELSRWWPATQTARLIGRYVTS